MSLESTTTIKGLVTTNPVAGDPVSQGDDHLRLIKAVLKNIFRSSDGLGFDAAITVSPSTINDLLTTTAFTAAAASQAEQEAAASTAKYVTPGRQQYHPSAAKVHIKCDAAGNINYSYNVTSITDNGTGQVTVTIATDFSSASYCVVPGSVGTNGRTIVNSPVAGSFVLLHYNGSEAAADPTSYCAVAFGDQ